MPEQEEQLSEFLNWQQACALIGCCRSHFYRLVNSGELHCAFKMGKRRGIRVPRKEVESYLQRQKIGRA